MRGCSDSIIDPFSSLIRDAPESVRRSTNEKKKTFPDPLQQRHVSLGSMWTMEEEEEEKPDFFFFYCRLAVQLRVSVLSDQRVSPTIGPF